MSSQIFTLSHLFLRQLFLLHLKIDKIKIIYCRYTQIINIQNATYLDV